MMDTDRLRKGLYVKFTPEPYGPGPKLPLHEYRTKYGEVRLIEPDNYYGTKVLVRLDEPLFVSPMTKTGPTGAWVRAELLEEADPLDKFIRRVLSDE